MKRSSRARHLLMTTSIVALAAASAPEAKAAACLLVSPSGLSFGGTISCVVMPASTVNGDIVLTGIVGQSGVAAVTAALQLETGTLVGAVRNSGTIEALGTGAHTTGAGIAMQNPFTMTGGITNSGLIKGAGTKIGFGIADGLSTFTGGIVNNPGGVITGVVVNAAVTGFAAGIVTGGTLYAGGITNNGAVVADPANSAAGILIQTPTYAGGITNNGTVNSTGNNAVGIGVFTFPMLSPIKTFAGGITNNGAIKVLGAGQAAGIRANATSFAGGLTNNGTISSQALQSVGILTDGMTFGSAGVGITNSGKISAQGNGKTGNSAFGIYVRNTFFNGGVSNGGTIFAGLSAAGGANNAFGINVGGDSAQTITFSGGITNAGLIDAVAKNGRALGIEIEHVSTFGGGITNAGTILVNGKGNATVTGILIKDTTFFSGGVTNSGTIITASSGHSGGGIVVDTMSIFGGGILNTATGVIQVNTVGSNRSATGIGVFTTSSFFGGVTSSGTIIATAAEGNAFGFSVAADTLFSGNAVNNGLVSVTANGPGRVKAVGIDVEFVTTFLGGITNSGTILAKIHSGQSAVGINVNDVSTFIGNVVNRGTISVNADGSALGIAIRNVSTFAGGVTNSGKISATAIGAGGGNATGIAVSSVDSFFGGVHNDGGMITATGKNTAFGINVHPFTIFTGGISSSGVIVATSTKTGGALGIASFGGSVFDGGISNGGTIQANAAGKISTTLGHRAFGIAAGTTFSKGKFVSTFGGGIQNSGNIVAVSPQGGAAGIFAGGVTSFSGDIVNAGIVVAQAGGFTNTGTISPHTVPGQAYGILLGSATALGAPISTFVGNVRNSGTIVATAQFHGSISTTTRGNAFGILVDEVTRFFGGISNNGTILVGTHTIAGRDKSAAQAYGIQASDGSTFDGGITNSGSIVAQAPGGVAQAMVVDPTFFTGPIINNNNGLMAAAGMTATGLVTQASSFTGGVTNRGTIQGIGSGNHADIGIKLQGSSFDGGITNAGGLVLGANNKKTAGADGILILTTHFTGGISNTGTVAASKPFGGAGAVWAIDFSAVQNSVTVTQTGASAAIVGQQTGGVQAGPFVTPVGSGAINGANGFSDTVNIFGGLLSGDVQGSGVTLNIDPATVEMAQGISIGTAATPIAVFNLMLAGDVLQFDLNGQPSPVFMHVNDKSKNGFINANSVALTGGSVHVHVLPDFFADSTTYQQVINSEVGPLTNTLPGTVAGVTPVTVDNSFLLSQLPSMLVPHPGRTLNTDDLVLNRPDFAAVPGLGYTFNQRNTGHQLEGLGKAIGGNPTGQRAEDLFGPLFLLSGPKAGSQYLMALDQLSGYQYAQGLNAAFGIPVFTNDTVQTVLAMGPARNGNWLDSASLRKSGMQVASGGQLLSDAGPQQTAQATGPSASPWTFWGRGYGVIGTLKDQTSPNNVAGFDQTRGGGILGADYQFSDRFLAGAVVNYAHTDVNFHLNAGHTNLDTYLLGLYAQYRMGPWYINASGGGGWNSYTTTRNIMFPMFSAVAHSSYNGSSANLYAETGYDLQADQFKLTPFVGVAWVHDAIDSFTETGAGSANKTVNSSSGDSAQSAVGARVSLRVQAGTGTLVPELRAVWLHEFADQNQTINTAFAGSPSAAFAINGAVIARDSGVLGLGLGYEFSPNTKLFLDYDGKFNADFTQHAVSAGLRVKF